MKKRFFFSTKSYLFVFGLPPELIKVATDVGRSMGFGVSDDDQLDDFTEAVNKVRFPVGCFVNEDTYNTETGKSVEALCTQKGIPLRSIRATRAAADFESELRASIEALVIPGIDVVLKKGLEFIAMSRLPGWNVQFKEVRPDSIEKADKDYLIFCESVTDDSYSRLEVHFKKAKVVERLMTRIGDENKILDVMHEFVNQCMGVINVQWNQIKVYPHSSCPIVTSVDSAASVRSSVYYPSVCVADTEERMFVKYGCLFMGHRPDLTGVELKIDTGDVEFL